MSKNDLAIQNLGDIKGLFDHISKSQDKERERKENELKESYPGQRPAVHPSQTPTNKVPDQMKVNIRSGEKNLPPDSVTPTL